MFNVYTWQVCVQKGFNLILFKLGLFEIVSNRLNASLLTIVYFITARISNVECSFSDWSCSLCYTWGFVIESNNIYLCIMYLYIHLMTICLNCDTLQSGQFSKISGYCHWKQLFKGVMPVSWFPLKLINVALCF